MKIGVFTVALANMPFADACKFLAEQGVGAVEIGCGGFPGKAHCDPEVLLNNPEKIEELKKAVSDNGLIISALSCHANMVHPNREKAAAFEKDFDHTVLLAEKLGIDTINTFSGCPGDCPESKYPNWVTCPWPEDFLEILDYQWNEVLIPFWKEKVKYCRAHGVTKIAFEMHPGFCVYNPETLLKLRHAVGPEIGANFDPSHLIWQGIDPVAAIKEIGKEGAMFHFHAKDTKLDKYNIAVNGVLDTKHYSDELNRSWIFRSVGYGNDIGYWKDISSALRLIGYDHVVSIEHEDSLMSQKEGLLTAIHTLKMSVIQESNTDIWWA